MKLATTHELSADSISRAEYIRRMIRAGRRQWGYDHEHIGDPHVQLDDPEDSQSNELGSNQLTDLEAAIERNLAKDEGVSKDELAELLLEDLQKQMKTALQSLKEDGKADIDLTKGGWVKTE